MAEQRRPVLGRWGLGALAALVLLWGTLVCYAGGALGNRGATVDRPAARLRQLAEEPPLYLSAQDRCRAPAPGERLPQLELVASWGGGAAASGNLTLATQLNLERLAMLENQCRSWPLALAAAVYVPLLGGLVWSVDDPQLNGTSVEKATAQLGAFAERIARKEGACRLRLHLYAEHCGSAGEAALYPFNALRNRALQMVETEAVLQLDVDFVVGREIAAEAASPAGWAALRAQLEGVPAVVLPCLEPNASALALAAPGAQQPLQQQLVQQPWGPDPDGELLQQGRRLALEAAEGGKERAAKLCRRGLLVQSAIVKFAAGHGPTDYARWVEAAEPYPVDYALGYEPYTIMLRRHVPWFDERFRGYGFDKMTGYLCMAEWGVTFSVHPRGFVVHVPHPVAQTLHVTKRLNKFTQLRQMYLDAKADLERGQYFPATAFGEQCALQPPPGEVGAKRQQPGSAGGQRGQPRRRRPPAARRGQQ